MDRKKPKLAVWKFASCDGCQLSLLDCEDELLDVCGAIEIANFPEASRSVQPGPYDVSLIEGSITTPHDRQHIRYIRDESKYVITIGACATAGGIQALRNFQDVDAFISLVYAYPEYIETLPHSTPISEHIYVDFELRGCPVNKQQLLEVVNALLNMRRPNIPHHSVCMDCKLSGVPCVMVAQGIPCMGPITQAGCGAICPRYHRGCYNCYGPQESANTRALSRHWQEVLNVSGDDLVRAYRSFNACAPEFKKASELSESTSTHKAARVEGHESKCEGGSDGKGT